MGLVRLQVACRRGKPVRSICTSIAAMLVLAGTSFAATINVPGDHATIQGAIDASSDGDVIAIAAGTYYEANLNTNNKAITIGSASGDLDVTIDAQQGNRVFLIESGEGDDTVIKDLVITGGSNTGIYCLDSNPTISGCSIENNTAAYGGGISCYDSSPTISGCTISGNTASSGGGIYCHDDSSPTISDCMIEGNTAHYYGGGILCDYSSPTISSCTIAGNTASDGGGIFSYNSNPAISESQICGNELDQINGDYEDYGGNIVADECPEEDCVGDVNGDGFVNIQDLLGVIDQWGSCDDECSADFNVDGTVNIQDLLIVLDAWGTCP